MCFYSGPTVKRKGRPDQNAHVRGPQIFFIEVEIEQAQVKKLFDYKTEEKKNQKQLSLFWCTGFRGENVAKKLNLNSWIQWIEQQQSTPPINSNLLGSQALPLLPGGKDDNNQSQDSDWEETA